jgi:hypothetical protein
VLPGSSRLRYSPTAVGAIMSSEHCMISDGTPTAARSLRLSAKKVASANRLAITGSVEQKLAASSPESSGCSGFFMIAGARKFAHPM